MNIDWQRLWLTICIAVWITNLGVVAVGVIAFTLWYRKEKVKERRGRDKRRGVTDKPELN